MAFDLWDGWWVTAFGFAAGVLLVLEAFLIRRGRIRKWLVRYYHVGGPFYVGGFGGLLAGAVAFVFMSLIIPASLLPGKWGTLSLLLVLLMFGSFALMFVWAFRPPEFVKPEWLKDAERRKREGLPVELPPDVRGGKILVGPFYYWASWGLFGVLVLGAWLLREPALLIGAGVGAVYLTTIKVRPRRRGSNELPSHPRPGEPPR